MRRPRVRTGHWPLVVSACGAVAAALLLGGGDRAVGQAATSANAVQATGTGPGTLISSTIVNGEPQAWGWKTLGRGDPAPVVDGSPLPFADRTKGQLVLTRWTPGTQWQLAQTPVGPDGRTTVPGVVPFSAGRAGTPHGGLALLGSRLGDTGTADSAQRAIEVKAPGGDLRELPDPPSTVLDTDAGEALSEGSSRVAFAAVDEGGATGVFVGALGVAREHAVLHWGGDSWSREPVCVRDEQGTVPDGCSDAESMPDAQSSLQLLAVSAPDTDHAWLLAKPDAATGRAFVLFRRVGTGAAAHWAFHDTTDVPLAAASDPNLGISGVSPLEYRSGKLTATTDGVWVDVGFTGNEGREWQAAMFLDQRAGGRVTSWCDAPAAGGGDVCDHPLGFRLPSSASGLGYRSFAWPGSGFGTRVISGPADVGISSDLKYRGTYATLEGDRFVRKVAHSANVAGGDAAFASPVEGWLAGPVHVTTGARAPSRLAPWALPVRRALTAIVPEAGGSPGDLGTGALAVGDEGTVVRYRPGAGWEAEFLLSSSGTRARPRLRGVAWPRPGVAYAVGDRGAQWRWRASTGLWEQDPGAPPDERYDLNAVAFDPSNPDRGYAVGRNGAILALNKSWDPEPIPADAPRTGALGGPADLTSVAFAGHEALVAAGGSVLANSGGGWHVDEGVARLLAQRAPTTSTTGPHIYAVAGLPDGGAVAAGGDPGGGEGAGVVLIRDGAGAPWRTADQPLDRTVIAAAAVRDGGRVRPVVSTAQTWPLPDEYNLNPPGTGSPPTLIPPLSIPLGGYLLRETAGGWRDEQETPAGSESLDGPPASDAKLALALGSDGEGWVAGGSSGQFLGSDGSVSSDFADIVATASISRYSQGTPARGPGAAASTVPMDSGQATFAVAGNARCEEACAAERDFSIGPDVNLRDGLALAAQLARQGGGPRAMLYTGGRLRAPGNAAANQPAFSAFEANRYAELMGSQGGGLGVYPALSAGEAGQGDASAFISAFAGFAAPFGSGAAPAGITPVAAAPTSGGARTHYAFDSSGPAGTVRVIVIDNSAGSLAESDAYQNPREGQADWLVRVLDDARARRIPAIVVGNKDLNERLSPPRNVASDARAVATLLRDKGASAYFFDRPEENRAYTIPAGTTNTIPTFASGALGYLGATVDSGIDTGGVEAGDVRYGLNSLMLAQIDVRHRDPATNRAPVTVRAVPLLEDLSIEAVDGTFLRRSQPALFNGLGRRPRAGDRADGSTREARGGGSGAYTPLPAEPCSAQQACLGRIDPEFRFSSSDPDIANFVRQDPNSDNQRKPYLDPRTDKPVASDTSGLLCAFNAGRTTVTIASGGRSFSLPVTIQQGSVQRPCGTTPLDPSRFLAQTPQRSGQPAAPPPPPPPAPAPSPSPAPPPPPPALVPRPAAPLAPAARAPARFPPVPIPPEPLFAPAVIVPPLPITARPIPPSGTSPVSASTPVTQPVSQAERQREDEEATEQSSAYSAYRPPDHPSATPWLAGLAVLAAFALAGTGLARRREPRRPRLARADTRFNPPNGGHRR